ncbi:MAG: hypothetical protein HYR51_14845 [Candidatus Rokubacteria bacterium]|nr:hypothetical protein [Candidatus Rokubacteria bacterium]
MPTFMRILRLVAIVLLVVVVVTVAKPAPAEADVLAILGIASLVVIGVMIVAYLIVASSSEPKTAQAVYTYVAVADAPVDAAP